MIALRPARFVDVPELVSMLVDLHPRTIYADLGEVNIDYARKLLAQMVQRHGHVHNGGTCVFVATDESEVIYGFVAGALSPVYHIGTKLMAQDVFLSTRPDAPIMSVRRLIEAYRGWAESCPKVVEIQLSHTDATPETAKIGSYYERIGFAHCGGIYRQFVNFEQSEQEAA